MLGGARAGQRLRLTADFATLGRHGSSDLQFDPEHDLDVSARHAAVFRQGPTFVVRDLGSTNGTWVNGERIRSDRPLEPGDRIRLGSRGPEVEFGFTELMPPPAPAPPPAAEPGPRPAEERGPASPAAPGQPPPSPRPPRTLPAIERQSTDLRIQMEVARQTDRLRNRILAAVLGVLAVAAGIIGWVTWSAAAERRAVAEERARLVTQVDSLERMLATAAEQASGMRQALDSARQETFRLRGAVTTRGTSAEALPALDSLVMAAIARNTPLLRAANLDPSVIEREQAPTTVMIFTEYAGGRAAASSGFVVRHRGDSSWIVTARHAVQDSAGVPAARLAASFARRSGVYFARTVARHDSADVAIVKTITLAGVRPSATLRSGPPPSPGEPVALIGFPMGLDLPMGDDWRRTGLTPTTTVASVSRSLPGLLQLDGYGVTGASGSPVFDARGEVAGMLYGGRPGTGGRILYAVPADVIRDLLDRL